MPALFCTGDGGTPGAEKLWLQDTEAVVKRVDNPWWIKVVEIIDEEREEVKVLRGRPLACASGGAISCAI